MSIMGRIITILILIIINGYFAGSEAALVAVNKLKIKASAENGNKKDQLILKYINNSNNFFSTTQVAITFTSFVNGFLAAEAFTIPILKLFGDSYVNNNLYQMITKIVITVILTYLQVVVGEVVPKRMALKNPEKFISFTIRPIHFFYQIFRPLIFLLSVSSNFLSKLLKIDAKKDEMTEDELRMMVLGSGDAIKDQEKILFERILDFDDQDVSDVMTHRTEIIGFDYNDSYNELLKIIRNEKFSRIPVYKDNLDNIMGVLYTKDLITKNINKNNFNIKKLVRKPIYVPEVMKTSNLFRQMQKSKMHIAFVVDEFGGTAGLVTMEDILEEIFGDIFDEYDDVIEEVKIIKENQYLIDGLASIDYVDDKINANLPIDDYDTLSGFILDKLGRLPNENEIIKFEYEGFIYEVVKYEENVIDEILVTKISNNENKKEDND